MTSSRAQVACILACLGSVSLASVSARAQPSAPVRDERAAPVRVYLQTGVPLRGWVLERSDKALVLELADGRRTTFAADEVRAVVPLSAHEAAELTERARRRDPADSASGPGAAGPPGQKASPQPKDPVAAATYSVLTPLLTGGLGLALAAGDVGVPAAILLVGSMTVAPSAGHIYTGDIEPALWFTLGRTAMASALLYGFLSNLFQHCDGTDCAGSRNEVGPLVYAGAIGWGALTLWDIIDSPLSAERVNRRRKVLIGLAPMTGERRTAGVVLGLSY